MKCMEMFDEMGWSIQQYLSYLLEVNIIPLHIYASVSNCIIYVPSAACMRRCTGSSLVQVMAYRMLGHYLNQSCFIVNWTPVSKFQWILNRNSIVLSHENSFENVVCQNCGHFVQREWVKQMDNFLAN